MTNIFDLSNEYNKKNLKKWWITLAEQDFLSKIDSLKSISSSPWYKLIVKYWERELMESINNIRDMDSSKSHEVSKYQAKLDLAQRFLSYLDWYKRN